MSDSARRSHDAMQGRSTAAWCPTQSWYVAAWSSEVGDAPFGRKLLDRDVVLFRHEGEISAIGGRCPHRFAPLALGQVIGSTVECPYHGLRFGPDGACAFNPHGDGRIPPRAHVPDYPVVERDGFIWIWMGNRDRCDPSLIPDYPFMNPQPGLVAHHGNYLHVRANFELMIDNLMDLSHVGWLHRGGLGNEFFGHLARSVESNGREIWSRHQLSDTPAATGLRHYLDSGDQPVDHWLDMRWTPSSCLALFLGFTWPGCPRAEGASATHTHILTPETERTTHYFFGSSRDFKLSDDALTERMRAGQLRAFEKEDEPMIHAVQEMMQTTDFMSLDPVLLEIDLGPTRVRRVLRDLIEAENHSN
jgi:phenylpropionate dioxygenase-like ring-hydroxylating dioxygenase large terminal subunit